MTASVKWMLLLPGVPIPNSCTTSLTGIKRGCGLTPFTVESLSTYRVLASDGPATSFLGDALDTHDCTHMILENLKVSGAQNTIKNQRLKFDSLEPFAITWIHAVGESNETDGTARRAVISMGPLGTVSP